MDAHVQHNGIRVSYGAQLVDRAQRREFPTGAYATTIEPSADDVGAAVVGRHFFCIEYSLPDPDDSRGPIDTSYFVAFCTLAAEGGIALGRGWGHRFSFVFLLSNFINNVLGTM